MPLRARSLSPLVLSLGFVGTGCADERDPADEGTSLTTPGTSDADSDPATTNPSGDDDDPPAEDSSEDSAEESGEADSTGSAPACSFAPGCYAPEPLATDRGIGSHIPVGCDGGDFRLAHAITVSQYADPEAPRSVPLLGDLDGDGAIDLAVNFRKASVGLVFRGLGDGRFDASPAPLAGGIFAGGWGGDLGDLDGDTALDVVLGDHARGAWAWRNAGAMSFVEARTGLPPDGLFSGAGLGDIDGDGVLDALFGADQFGSGVRAFAGDGQGGWSELAAPAVDASGVGSFAFGDVDGNGDLEAVAFGGAGSGIDAFVLDYAAGAWSVLAQVPGVAPNEGIADPRQGALGDVDCDGDLDLAVGGAIAIGQGGTFGPATAVDAAAIARLADMNGDGFLDLVTHDPSVGLALYLGDGSGTQWTPAAVGLPGLDYLLGGVPLDDSYGIAIADLDGNDALDIVRIAGFAGIYFVEAWVR